MARSPTAANASRTSRTRTQCTPGTSGLECGTIARVKPSRAARTRTSIGEEQRGGILHTEEPAPGHLEQTELLGGSEPVLHDLEQPQRVVAITLEGEDGIDDVLEDPRPGQRPLLGDVADQH